VLDGLKWLEQEAKLRSTAERTVLFQTMASKSSDPALTVPQTFFRRFRALTIGAYYTTEAGFADIGYIGNVAMASYPGPSDAVKAVLDRELRKLGL
jgi:hypothetical protein